MWWNLSYPYNPHSLQMEGSGDTKTDDLIGIEEQKNTAQFSQERSMLIYTKHVEMCLQLQ